ncbi:hypothetical protein CWI38_1692p0010 [Hamiltosporidium tvaerminnensis]|uniref:Uncharacterized protein n=1 Tax=Hamiltosporidium tvaerminnensis TaxID=1176355 RepID=A0A4Q9LQ32_9MICR|nr:hypothetical protein CWI38_1692p0010 [Hamiltosporidium tvaerminnensis]
MRKEPTPRLKQAISTEDGVSRFKRKNNQSYISNSKTPLEDRMINIYKDSNIKTNG